MPHMCARVRLSGLQLRPKDRAAAGRLDAVEIHTLALTKSSQQKDA
jgi:hypothetical protein